MDNVALPQEHTVIGPGSVGRLIRSILAQKRSVQLLGRGFERIRAPQIVWLCVKAYDIGGVLTRLAPILSEATPLVVAPNGLGVFEQVRSAVDARIPVVRALLYVGVRPGQDNELIVSGEMRVCVACEAGFQPFRDAFIAELESIGIKTTSACSPLEAEWHKMFINLTVNPICTLLGVPNGAIVERTELMNLTRTLLSELKAIAQADGIDLSNYREESLFSTLSNFAANINSSLVDLRRGKPSELPLFFNQVQDRAHRYGVKTPNLDCLEKLCLAHEALAIKREA